MDNEKIKEAWPGWEVVRLIGNGGFGSVYEIRREEYGVTEKAALKVITIPHSQSDIDDLYSDGYDEQSITSHYQYYIEDIVKEYKLMKNLSGHSNIVDCDDYRIVKHTDDIGWDIFIKMELLIPLSKVLKNRNNAVDEELVVQIGQDVCQALVLCNSRKIVHRDIKPENIFVSQDGNFKLGDFGIAKVATRTTSGTKTGTYKYMAPEVFNNEPYGDAADIYSLGLVLYWLMNEFRMPFMVLPPDVPTVAQREEAAKRRFAGEPIPAPKNGSEMMKKIVLKACDFKPENRYHTAMEMLEDLNQVEAALLMDSGNASDSENSTVTGETLTDDSVGTIGGTWAANVGDHRYPDSPSGPSMTENSRRSNSFYGSGNSVYNSGEDATVYNDSFRFAPDPSFREEPAGLLGRFRKLSTPVILGAGALIVVLALVILLGGKGDKGHIISVFNDDDEVASVDEPQTTTDANGNVITVPGSSGKSGGSSNSKSDSKSEDSGGVNLWDVIGGLFAGSSSDDSSSSSNSNNSSNKTNNTSNTNNKTNTNTTVDSSKGTKTNNDTTKVETDTTKTETDTTKTETDTTKTETDTTKTETDTTKTETDTTKTETDTTKTETDTTKTETDTTKTETDTTKTDTTTEQNNGGTAAVDNNGAGGEQVNNGGGAADAGGASGGETVTVESYGGDSASAE